MIGLGRFFPPRIQWNCYPTCSGLRSSNMYSVPWREIPLAVGNFSIILAVTYSLCISFSQLCSITVNFHLPINWSKFQPQDFVFNIKRLSMIPLSSPVLIVCSHLTLVLSFGQPSLGFAQRWIIGVHQVFCKSQMISMLALLLLIFAVNCFWSSQFLRINHRKVL